MVSADASEISGSMHVFSSNKGTLDEPVSITILRDVQLVAGKLKVVLMPGNTSEETLNTLRDCKKLKLKTTLWRKFSILVAIGDLWGPLMLCLSLSIMLSFAAPPDQSAMVFTGVFVIVWVGAAIVTVNAQLLGSTISFFQSMCVLGYCVFPLNIATSLCLIIGFISTHLALRLLIVIIGFLWSTRASVVFMSKLVTPSRKALSIYPVLLFYLFISWMILVQ